MSIDETKFAEARLTANGAVESAIEPLPQVPALSHRVHTALERLIITRSLPLGARLVEGELAQMLGVSRGPIREALQRLAQDGFVELRPRQGAFVHVPTMTEVDNFYDVRRVLEGESARLAALRITPARVKELRDCIALADQILAKDQDPATTAPDLHLIIASIAQNELLVQLLALLSKRSDWYLSPYERHRRRRAWHEHVAIVDAIAKGDPAAAEKAMREHIDRSQQIYKELAPLG